MIVLQQFALSDEARAALDRAVKRSPNITWADVEKAMQGHGWAIWNVGDRCWCFTVINDQNEIEVWLAGGRDIHACLGPWEAAMRAHPAHRGMTMWAEARKGWRRLLPHWTLEGDVLTTRIAG